MKGKLSELIKNSPRPFLIAGPCSAESENQMMEISRDISAKANVSVLRAGIWKPRTRPDSFEGVGAIGLPWLVQAGKTYNMPVATEIANARHVEQALKAEIDILWIGARTSVNPFAVQEIADALKGTDTPVMIKNPVNPDLSLWIGAFERLQKNGLSDLTAVHRGFSIYKHPKYRNVPNWEIPIGLKEAMPKLPIIGDPSHISGKREGLLPLAQKAMDLNFDGLMIETHPDPDNAWSDSEQQVTAQGLKDILDQLVLRKDQLSGDVLSQMEIMREKIGTLDDRIFELISARMRMSEEIGIYKRENDITILQQEHWRKMIAGRLSKANDYQLTESFIRSMMDAIHQESIRHQTKVMNFRED